MILKLDAFHTGILFSSKIFQQDENIEEKIPLTFPFLFFYL